jgi:hypothetical protein
MGRAEEGTAGSFVNTTGFDPDETILDDVNAANGVGTGDFVGVHEEFEWVGLFVVVIGGLMDNGIIYRDVSTCKSKHH